MQLTTPQPTRHSNPTTKASALAYAIFDRPDLKKAEEYLIDFGLRPVSNDGQLLLMRGTGPAPYCYVVQKADKPRFVGFGLEVETRADLEALSKLPGASAIEKTTWPGGGERVRLTDPSGFRVDAIFGRAAVPELPHRPPLPLNSVDAPARVNGTQRPPFAPPGRDPPRACRARARRLPGDLGLVHPAFRLHPERRAGAARRLAGGRLHAARSRRQADRPPHARAGAGVRARASTTSPSSSSIRTPSAWAIASCATGDGSTPGAWGGIFWAARSSTTGRTPGGTSTSTIATAISSPPTSRPASIRRAARAWRSGAR